MRLACGLLTLALITTEALAEDAGSEVERGKYLATAGDCVSCHTKPGGEAYAGGRLIGTPFGGIYSPNLTPDKETGIGNYTDDQFYAALHTGIGSKGQYLYPVLPFTSYTNVTRSDVLAIKAYLFSLKPVNSPNQGNTFSFPYNIRASLAVWRELFFKPGEFKPDHTKSDQINRGAYLVDGLEHCNECHTKRNSLGGPETSKGLQGASVQGWYAPNITSDWETGIGQWSEDELFAYLKTGATPKRGIAVGPMAEVVHGSLSQLTDDDIRSIAVYLKSTPPVSDKKDAPSSTRTSEVAGSAVYVERCASCHGVNGKGVPNAIPALSENGSVTAATGDNVVKVVLGGLRAAANYGPMPSFADTLSDEEIASLTNYVRTSWSNAAKANTTVEDVARQRKTTRVMLALGEGDTPCPQDLTPAEKAVKSKITDDQQAVLRETTEKNLATAVRDVLPALKTASPEASPSDLTNALSTAYCEVVEKSDAVAPKAKRPLVTKFSQLTYTLASSGKLYGPGNAPVAAVK